MINDGDFYITYLIWAFEYGTEPISSISDIKNNSEYTTIVNIGKSNPTLVIGAILNYMRDCGTLMFMAIGDIIEDKSILPIIPEEIQGRLEEIRKLYLEWGFKQGYINGIK